MSKASKARAAAKRKNTKAMRKQANRDMWKELSTKGLNKKAKGKNAKKKFNPISHPEGNCGNIGCKRCNPVNFFESKKKTPTFQSK